MDRRSSPEEPRLIELSKLVAASRDGARLLQNPYDNSVCKLSYNKNVNCIELVWRKYATSPQLRYIHEVIVCMLVQYGVSTILTDYTDLPIIHAEDQRWIVGQWLPRAIAAGLKATASVISMTFFGQVAIRAVQSALTDQVQVRSFRDVHSARRWLKDFNGAYYGNERGRRE
jgi:hypothetical protein